MFFLASVCTSYFLAFFEEQENTKVDTTVPTMVHKEPELKINYTVGIPPENVELVSQLEENYPNKMNNETQTKVDTIDESDGNFSNEKIHPKIDNPNAVVPQNENVKIEMDLNIKNENNIVAVFETNDSVQSEVNGEMDNTHGVVILPYENLKTEMENTKNISNPLTNEILSHDDNTVLVFPTTRMRSPKLTIHKQKWAILVLLF